MFGKKPSKPTSRIDTLIGVATELRGDLIFGGGLRVDGKVNGNIQSAEGGEAATLVVSETGSVTGEVRVSHLVVNGTIVGPIFVDEYVEVQSKARITGDITYRSIEMHLGAVLEGKLLHQDGLGATPALPPVQTNDE